MASPLRPAPAGDARETTFTRNLRFEWAGEEGRALVGSYAFSVTLAAIFLFFVYTTEPVEAAPVDPEFVSIDVVDPAMEQQEQPVAPVAQEGEAETPPAPGPTERDPGPEGPESGTPTPNRPGSRTEQNTQGAIGTAFGTGSGSGTGGLVGDVSNVLRGVDVSSGTGGTGGGLEGAGGGGTGGKTVLGYGQGGQGARTPGRGGIGGGTGTGGGGGGGIGNVGGGGGVTRAAVRVSSPVVVRAPDLAGPGRDMSDLGSFVRSRQAELRYCYEERGLKADPNLAGTVSVAITIAGNGRVSGANITRRTWSGGGASAAESCILGKIRGWRFPSSTAGEGTYSFPFNFTT
ncbi:MAG: AgmX/PglI C-terminal domain-containing protein [Gemmatimonadaceae bacterium]